jgi:hypothetical protein
MWWLAVSAALVSGSLQMPGPLGFFDGARLADTCAAKGGAAASKQSVCLGYVGGVVDLLMLQQGAADAGVRTICPPAAFTLDSAVRAVMDRSNLAKVSGGVSAAGFVKFALEDAFPCRREDDTM